MSDDEDVEFGGLYEDGHWEWSEVEQKLAFVSDSPPEASEVVVISTKVPTGTVEFKDDIDVIEQMRFRRRYARKVKPGQPDVITLQDVKDLALYTAPITFLSPSLINILHVPTTERFIRALIIYCQYYLQTADTMACRMEELELKIRTPDGEEVENMYRENIEDLRLVVAKEYCSMLIGGADTRKFHHMGPNKKSKSLSDKDARLFETLLRMCVQIVWLALGRRSFNQIELELNRLFKTEIFNSIEHKLKTGYLAQMSKEERMVLLGLCARHDKKLNSKSPLINSVNCHRKIDYRMMGLGVIKYTQINNRLQYIYHALADREELFAQNCIVVGILGMNRSDFDTMLRIIPTANAQKKNKSKLGVSSGGMSKSSNTSGKSLTNADKYKLYSDIALPHPETKEPPFPEEFPSEPLEIRPCSEVQRRRWLNRLKRYYHPQH